MISLLGNVNLISRVQLPRMQLRTLPQIETILFWWTSFYKPEPFQYNKLWCSAEYGESISCFQAGNFVKSGTGRNQGVGGHCKGEWKGEWWRMTSLEQDEVSRVWRHGPRNLDVACSPTVSAICNQLVTMASKVWSPWRTMRTRWRLQLSFKTEDNVLCRALETAHVLRPTRYDHRPPDTTSINT